MLLLRSLCAFAFIQGVVSRSIQNITLNESKIVTLDMFEGLKKNMSELLTDLVEKSFRSLVQFDRNYVIRVNDKKSNNEIPEMQDETQKGHIFFYARMRTSPVTLNKNSILKFGTVLYNKGNHFNPGDSIFIAPVAGVYLFSWTILSYSSKNVNTELRVSNVVKETLNANQGSASGYLLFTRTIVCDVTKGNHVWIQTGNTHTANYFESLYGSSSSFMGILMYKT